MQKALSPRAYMRLKPLSCVSRRRGVAPLLQVSLCTLGYLCITNNISLAQVTPDGTTNTTVNPNGNNFTIENGDRAGGNLFHSFQDFSVPNGGSAVFNNATDISNIFSRVTGGNISNIDGLIRANGSASLFLINPAGIVFGEGARLDVGGSFYGSSATSILFKDGEFSAADLENPPLLTVNAPIGLGFRDDPGDIVNRSNFDLTTTVIDETINPAFAGAEFTILDAVGLQVNPNQTIALVGGNVVLENAGAITAPGGRVELGGISQAGEITINENGSLTFPQGVTRGDVTLTGQARVKVAADGGGFINVNANNLELSEQSELYAGITEDAGSPEAQAGDITINATESVKITGSGGIGDNAFALLFNDYDTALRNVVGLRPNEEGQPNGPNLLRNPKPNSTAVGNGGTINIETNVLELSDRGSLTAKVYGQGNTDDFNIQANDIVINQGDILNQVISGSGNAGDINIAANNLTVIGSPNIDPNTFNVDGDVSFILADTRSSGDSGNINIDVANEIKLDGISLIATQVFSGGEGNAGDLTINAGTFTAEGALLQSKHDGEIGNPGNITIDVEGDIALDHVLLNSELANQGTGNESGGNIFLNAANLNLTNGSAIEANTKGQGDAGNININVDNEINFDFGSRIDAKVDEGAVGNGGKIDITANSLSLNNGSQFNAQTFGRGDGGNIKIDADNKINLDNGSNIESKVIEGAVGNAGKIDITANSLSLNNGSQFNAQTLGQGNAGDINIATNEAISLANGSIVLSIADIGSEGNGGKVLLTSGELNLTNNSEILADIVGQGNAGNIDIDVTGDINLNNNSKIQSQVRDGGIGNAGNITINTGGSLFSIDGNLILADSQAKGDGGSITINAGEKILLEGIPEGGFPSQIVAGLTKEDAEGKGGTIVIDAGELVLDDVAFISSNTVKNTIGAAGSITINVDSLNLSENALINVFTANDFDGGEITINAQTLDLFSGGKILAATDGKGNAGNINLNISEQITIDNSIESSADLVNFGEDAQLLNDLQSEPSGIYANATENSTGKGGSVNIGLPPAQAPNSFKITNDAQIVVSSEGEGSGGNIFLRSQALELDNKATISASTNFGQGGEITLQITEDLTLDNNSSISARAFQEANGGNLNIDARFIVASPSKGTGNDFVATAADGEGGDINLNAEQIFGLQVRDAIDNNNNFINNSTNDIDVSSDVNGLDGNVTINTSDLNPLQGAVELPSNIVELEQTTAQACNADRESVAQNSFTIKGKGGIMSEPGSPLNSANITINGENANSTSAIPQAIATSQGHIQPARGVKVTESGEVILTAYRTNNSGDRIPEVKPNCGV